MFLLCVLGVALPQNRVWKAGVNLCSIARRIANESISVRLIVPSAGPPISVVQKMSVVLVGAAGLTKA